MEVESAAGGRSITARLLQMARLLRSLKGRQCQILSPNPQVAFPDMPDEQLKAALSVKLIDPHDREAVVEAVTVAGGGKSRMPVRLNRALELLRTCRLLSLSVWPISR